MRKLAYFRAYIIDFVMKGTGGELRQAKRSEIDFAEKVSRVPAERMKIKQPHAVPLSRQVLFILQDLRSLARTSEFLFLALHTTRRPISDNT